MSTTDHDSQHATGDNTGESQQRDANRFEHPAQPSHEQSGYQKVKRDLSNMKADAAELRDDALQSAREAFGEGVAAARHQADAAADSVRHTADSAWQTAMHAAERAQGAHENVCKHIRKNPTAAVLAALGVGVLVGKLMRK